MKTCIKTFASRNPDDIDAKINGFLADGNRERLALAINVTEINKEPFFTYVVTYREMTKKDVFRNTLQNALRGE